MNIKVKCLDAGAVIPRYAKPGDAGFDLVSVDFVWLKPGESAVVSTGLAFEIPEGYEMQIRPRSGLSAKTKLRVSNAPGTIDSGYRGEIKVLIDNISTEDSFTIGVGDRIAQGVIAPVFHASFTEVDELSETERGDKGFGSTGVRS